MAGDKYLYNNQGTITEKLATQTSTGASDAGKIIALDSTGKLDNSMMPVGIGAETQSIPTTEDLSAGDFVNIYSSSGAKVRKADATTSGKEADGFVLVSTLSGQNATVYFPSQTNTVLTGLTPGVIYYLSTIAGQITITPPSGSGNVIQKIGRAGSASSIVFVPSDPIVLA